jgi:hypothetical protein
MTRAVGVAKVGGAIVEASAAGLVAAGSGGLAVPIAGLIAIHAADDGAAGIMQIISGEPQQSFTSKGIESAAIMAGAAEDKAHAVGEIGDGLLGFAGALSGARVVAGLPIGRVPTAPALVTPAGSEAFRRVEELTVAAAKPHNEAGLSVAARALEKHSGRPGGTFGPLTGSVEVKNQIAGDFVKRVLTDPRTVRTELARGGIEYRMPNGQGIRYNSDGSFSGILDPRK